MPDFRLTNNWQTETLAPIGTGDLSLQVSASAVAAVPNLSGGGNFAITLWDGEQAPEIVYVTAALGTTLTIVRGCEGTSARAWPAGTQAVAALTRDMVQEIYTSYSSGLGGVVAKAGDTMTGFLTLHAAPTAPLHAATKSYVDTAVAGVSGTAFVAKAGDVMLGNLDMAGYRLLNIPDGVDPDDPVALNQMTTALLGKENTGVAQTLLDGIVAKAPVRLVATSNITLSGEQTIDGVLTAASRILVVGQTTGSQNGIYVTGSGAWTRAADSNTWNEIAGAITAVLEGTTPNRTIWRNTNGSTGTLGTTAITYQQITPGENVTYEEPWQDLASAATTNIGAATTDNLRITGNVTITSFGTAASGVRRTLRFASALTLTHNASSLILPTGANITTAADDTAEAISLGAGNWILTDYQRASGKSTLSVLNYQFFGTAGAATWIKPAGTLPDDLVYWYAAGGGGGGAVNAQGAGGGGGAAVWGFAPALRFNASEGVTIGAGGAAGGASGGQGGATIIMQSLMTAFGGGGASGATPGGGGGWEGPGSNGVAGAGYNSGRAFSGGYGSGTSANSLYGGGCGAANSLGINAGSSLWGGGGGGGVGLTAGGSSAFITSVGGTGGVNGTAGGSACGGAGGSSSAGAGGAGQLRVWVIRGI